MNPDRKSFPGARTLAVALTALSGAALLLFPYTQPALTADLTETVITATPASLRQVVRDARAGSTILLAPGDYGSLVIKGSSFERPITLRSAQPGQPARFASIRIDRSQGLQFQSITIAAITPNPSPNRLVDVMHSSRIGFTQIRLTSALPKEASLPVRGLYVRNSSDITLRASTVDRIYLGGFFGNSNGIAIENNVFNAILGDGVNFAGVQNVVIRRNLFRSFDHIGGSHADAIQIFTTHTTGSAGVTIEENRIFQEGGTPLQGMLISSQNGSRHANVIIKRNIVLTNDMPLGIALHAVDGIRAERNFVASGPRSRWPTKLQIRDSTDVAVRDNVTTRLVIDGNLVRGGNGNKIIAPKEDDTLARLSAEFEKSR